MPILATQRARDRQTGIGMIEVLIAVLIVSIGFLGMAALQAKALSTNNSAMARSMATVASYSILDAMRTDLTSAEAGAYGSISAPTTVIANACPVAGGSLASVQLNQWCTQLGDTLGATASTKGTIACSITAQCTITITFNDSRSGTEGASVGSSAQQVVTRAGL
ncbi:MAG: type IV pilus modification protein PilV [Rhodanobacteraceae bacterium]|nr:MAG: type IV pilus modification protein PilV [Rhodanobacteraceae bacterium]